MNLTGFFRNCASALKSSIFGSSENNEHSAESGFIPTDEQALELFAEIRAMPLSHKSERGNGSACDLRAHAIYVLLAERGVEGIEKGWISSPLAPNGRPNFLIKPPVEVHYALRDIDLDEEGRLRQSVKDDEPFNIHVATVVTTREGRRLVFDTYFYEHPPELEQWLEDFKPYEEGVELKHQLTDPDYVGFEQIGMGLPREGSIKQLVERGHSYLRVKFQLNNLDSNPVETPLQAKWLSPDRDLEQDVEFKPE